jgi:hypothetical protein
MGGTKFDAALNVRLSRHIEGKVGVSVRLSETLTSEEAAEFQSMGLAGADTRRLILFGDVSSPALSSLAGFDKVARISLAQQMAPKQSKK